MIHDGYSKERVIDEIEKCVVLCANCHRKFHGGLFKLPDNDTIESPIID
jgi:predicted HNH restriction endonuclease